jgi:hypothetical protein
VLNAPDDAVHDQLCVCMCVCVCVFVLLAHFALCLCLCAIEMYTVHHITWNCGGLRRSREVKAWLVMSRRSE